MTWCEVEHPFKESAGWFEQRFDREVEESVLMEVVKEAPQDYESFSTQRPMPPEATEGEFLVVSFDGKGVPMIKAEAVKLKAKLGTGEKRQKKRKALVGVSYTVDPKPRSPEALAELLVDPEAARARRQQDDVADEPPKAQQVRRLASLVRTQEAVMELIKAEAERRDPQHRKPLVVLLDGALGLWLPRNKTLSGACESGVTCGTTNTYIRRAPLFPAVGVPREGCKRLTQLKTVRLMRYWLLFHPHSPMHNLRAALANP